MLRNVEVLGMRRLVESWVQFNLSRGRTLADSIRKLNDARGSKVTHSRLSEWRRGVYVPEPAVTSMMLLETLPWALRQAGIEASREEIARLQDMLWNTREENGKTLFELY
jgi:hypothetical protein